MNIKHSLIYFFILITVSLYGQNEGANQEKSRSLTFYVNGHVHRQWDIENQSTSNPYTREITFGQLSVALYTNNEDNRLSHEFEFAIPFMQWDKTWEEIDLEEGYQIIEGKRILEWYTGGRYQLNYHFMKAPDTWNPYIGMAAGLTYRARLMRPIVSLYFPADHHQFNLPVELVPGLKVNLNKQFALDINMPVEIHRLTMEIDHVSNPMLPVKLQRETRVYGVLLPKVFHIRFGLLYRF